MHSSELAVTHCEAELERVVNSELLSHSPALVTLLRYLAQRSLAGEGESLKEYTIGVEALGKSAGYDTQADPSVRSQVRRLRAKLAEYYGGEGRENPSRISLPKGGFQLHFAQRRVSVAERAADATARLKQWRRLALILAVAVCVLALSQIRYFFENEHPVAAVESGSDLVSDDIRKIWQPHLDGLRPAIICLGIPVFFQMEREPQQPSGPASVIIRDSSVNSVNSEHALEQVSAWSEIIGADTATPWNNYMAVGEALGAYRLGKVLLAAGVDIPVVRSNALSWDEIRTGDVIFLGAPKLNPHLQIDDLSRHFRVTNRGVENPRPADGEPGLYPNIDNGRERVGVAVFGRYPAPVGGGYATVIGSDMNLATWAAVEYLTRPQHARDLVHSFDQQFGGVPQYFEVVIQARFHDEHPIEIECLAMREVTIKTVEIR